MLALFGLCIGAPLYESCESVGDCNSDADDCYTLLR